MRAGAKERRCATGQGAEIIPQLVKGLTSAGCWADLREVDRWAQPGLELKPASNANHSPGVVYYVRLEAALQLLECVRSEDPI